MRLSTKTVVPLALLSPVLNGCYIIPMDADGNPIYPGYPVHAAASHPATGAPSPSASGGARPASLPARLYPANDVATETGVVTGVVTNMMTGKGRFNLDYKGDTFSGEATRVSGDDRRGVASAFSPSGAYMSCEYQMSSPYQGAGTCTFSSGAKYQLHIGS